MREQRRHQRVRFAARPRLRVGQYGFSGGAELENLSLGGMLLRTDLSLKVNEGIGCEFTVFDSPLIDLRAQLVSRVGNLYTARFQAGPVSECLIQDAIRGALASGRGSVLSINEVDGRKVMRISGGFNDGLRSDFLYNLQRSRVDELDLSGVTGIDGDGVALCRLAVDQHKIGIGLMSPCVRALMAA